MRRVFLGLALCLTACPERTRPERGVRLVFAKPEGFDDDLRPVVERRLAQLKQRAVVHEEARRLTVRVREGDGADVELIRRALLVRAKLEFCREDAPLARGWCHREWPEGVTSEGEKTCLVRGAEAAVRAALINTDGGVPESVVVWEHGADQSTAYAQSSPTCTELHVTRAERTATGDGVMLTLDRAGALAFEQLTTKAVGERLLFVLDGEVLAAPVVKDPIRGGRAMVPLHRGSLEVWEAALHGGALPKLKVESEEPYGPPSL